MLRTLPRSTRRRVPFSILHRRLLAPLALLLVACLVGVGVWVAAASHHGTASNAQRRATGIQHGALINLCQNCAAAYNPDAPTGQNSQNNSSAGLAIDGSISTGWPTQQYYTGSLDKPGVGLYVKAGRGTTASRLVLETKTPGFAASIYATNTDPDASSFSASHWVQLASVSSVSSNQTFQLSHSNTRFVYYLVWITKLPPSRMSALLNELSLYS